MHAMTKRRAAPYILPEAFTQLNEELKQGQPYNSALLNVAIRFSVSAYDLRKAYEHRRRIDKAAQAAIYLACAAALLTIVLTY